MLKLSDNELDDFSREAAEKFEPAGNAQSWDKLEQLLDKNLGKPTPIPKTIRPGTIYLYSGAILIAVSVTYFLIKSKKNNQNSTPQDSALIHQQSSAKNDKSKEATSSVILKGPSQGATGIDKVSAQKSAANNGSGGIASHTELPEGSAREGKKIIQSASAKDNSSPEPNSGALDQQTVKGKRDMVPGKPAVDRTAGGVIHSPNENAVSKEIASGSSRKNNDKRNSHAGGSSGLNASGERDLVLNNTRQRDLRAAGNRHHRSNRTGDEKNKNGDAIISQENPPGYSSTRDEENTELKFAPIPGIQPLTEPYFLISDSALRSFKSTNKLAAVVRPDRARTHGAFINQSLQVGILFAPEFSEVKHIYENNRIGNNLGVTLSYQLFSKISINSGFIFSKKYYQANDQGFHAPKGAVDSTVDIKFVNGSANVIDIPLNIRYNYFSDENSIFFVNAGFSSYLMSKQDVSLFCQPNHNNNSNFLLQYPVSGSWIPPASPPENKTYLFSVLNLSAGFETSLGNNFSFQFEPYVKLPVKGIGYGKVNMTSYGVNFSLKYAPVLKRGRRL